MTTTRTRKLKRKPGLPDRPELAIVLDRTSNVVRGEEAEPETVDEQAAGPLWNPQATQDPQ